ncbi:hypothetical protein MSAN_01161500 [Mycena sanguinolenta]|uniref:Uncharacterized protein n=1 Tax=Mycena sanguinolenta TaxID=230812 RepID=A0A8H6YHK3_9AGAR|nr:hypothetical protein MSAN_01161500 [Mycena sanguinolenta]
MLDQIPPEILGYILQIGIETWGIGLLSTICLVSSACRDVVVSTPSLWGIFVVDKHRSWSLLNRQLVQVKAADLRITIPHKSSHTYDKHARKFFASLVPLAPNWVRVEMPTNVFSAARWADMRRVEVLRLRFHGGTTGRSASQFFESSEGVPPSQSNLHSFTGSALPEEWVTPFLSPRITYLELGRLGGQYGGRYKQIPASLVHGYLALAPNVHTLCLPDLSFLPFSESKTLVSLRSLHNLELARVRDLTPLLLGIRAPALRALTIRDSIGQLNSVFSQWSQPSFLPANLQLLELANSLSTSDIPFFIGFLARLPALIRLIVSDTDEINPEHATVETDLFKALASPDGAGPIVGGWLCPSLLHLCIDVPLRVVDVLPIARARGNTTARIAGSPARLRSLQGPLCSSGSEEEMSELRSYFADPEDVRCLCLSCSFNLSATM